MKLIGICLILAIIVCTLPAEVSAVPVYSAISYTRAIPVNCGKGCTVRFSLWDSAEGGTEIWSEKKQIIIKKKTLITALGDTVTLDTVDFSEQFWVQTEMRQSDGSYRLFETRDPLRAAPYALFSPGQPGAGDITGVTAGTGLIGGGLFGDVILVADTAYLQRRIKSTCASTEAIRLIDEAGATTCVPVAGGAGDITGVIAGTGLTGGGTSGDVTLSADTSYLQRRVSTTCPAGSSIRAINQDGTVSCEADDVGSFSGWGLTGNIGTNPSTNFVGTLDNQELRVRVNNTVALRIQPTTDTPNLIGGSSYNTALTGVVGGVIGGGGNSTEPNTVNDCYSTIGGGAGNRAGQSPTCDDGNYNTVGGGYGNFARFYAATVGGGNDNLATGTGATIAGGWNNRAIESLTTVGGGYNNHANYLQATIAGGDSNSAEGWASVGGGIGNAAGGMYSTIAGGEENTASGRNSMIPGGWQNVAAGDFSFAAGVGARANNQGCFVWNGNDNSSLPSYLDCNNDYRWLARASGGVYFYTNSGLTSGVYVPAGGNAWSTVSDRAMKNDFKAVDGKEVLIRLAAIPLQSWSYKSEDPSIRHIGPVAQDFYSAFGLGESERHISTIDADGVALAAIQGVYALLQEKEERMQRLEKDNIELRQEIMWISKQLRR